MFRSKLWAGVFGICLVAGCSDPNATRDAGRDVAVSDSTDISIDMSTGMDVTDTPIAPDTRDIVDTTTTDTFDAQDVPADVPGDDSAAVDVPQDIQCDAACPNPANAVGSCAAGACTFACNTGFADCNTDATDGCEVEFAASHDHCGACATACGMDQRCNAGTCEMCGAGQIACGNSCADTTADAANCGACGTTCPVPAHGVATCVAGTCGFTCDAGYTDCDLDSMNGCEAQTAVDPVHCGSCANVCPTAGGVTTSCVAGLCAVMCPAGRGDCDGDISTPCETDTTSSASNCGRCAMACPARAHATATCVGSACGYRCDAGWEDCDRDPMNGCEANLAADTSNCNECGTVCPSPPSSSHAVAVCNSGSCAIRCSDPTNYENCNGLDSDGCEAPLNADPANCDRCLNSCGDPARNECFARMCCTTFGTNTTCAAAQNFGDFRSMNSATATNKIPHGGDSRWYTFIAGSGRREALRITLRSTAAPGRFRFEVRTGSCGTATAVACQSGMPTGLTDWSFVDNAAVPPGEIAGPPYPRATGVATPIYIRVYSISATESCADFTLTATSNPVPFP